MTDKHTPGHWFVPDQTLARNLTVEVDDGIACPGSGGAMSYTTEVCVLGWKGTPEWDANARLIAAAPDMLEALRELTSDLRSYETEYSGRMYKICSSCDAQLSEDQRHKSDCVWPKIDAAIAKAEGRA